MTYKKVNIPLEGRFKFVLISTQEGEYLRGGNYYGEHADIAANAREQEGLEGSVRGGGFIEINPHKRKLYAFGCSERYGSAPQLGVERLLEEYCFGIGYKLNVVMDDVADGHLGRRYELRMKMYVQHKMEWLKEFRKNNLPAAKRELIDADLIDALIDAKETIKMLEKEYWNYSDEYTNELKALVEEIERENQAKRDGEEEK